MRKNHELRIDRKKLLTLSIAATFMLSTLAIIGTPKAFAASPGDPVNVGTGPGSIFLTLHRIPASYWDPCFAWSCQNLNSTGGVQTFRGPGTWMFFTVYDSSGTEVGNGYANEDGTMITGLQVGQTYRVAPVDCGNITAGQGCDAGPEVRPHIVFFNNWADCSNPDSSVQERSFKIGSAVTVPAAGFYRYYPTDAGIQNTPDQCFAGVVGKPTHHSTAAASRHISVDMADVYKVLNLKQAVMNSIMSNQNASVTNVASIEANSTLLGKMIPSTNLSGTPLGPYGTVVYYNSLYDIQNSNPDGLVSAMNTAPILGIDWNSLSDMQKAYLTVTLQYNTPTANSVPSTNLSGIPLGPGGQKVSYNSLYDVQNADSDGIIKAMIACDNLGIDWNSLSDMQKAYLALTLDYGAPSSQV